MPVPRNFEDWLRREIARYRGAFPPIRDNGHAFAGWALGYVNELDEDEAFDLTDTLARGDGGLDGYYFDQADDEFILMQSKYPDDFTDRASAVAAVRELVGAYQLLLDPRAAAARNPKLGEIALRLRDAVRGGTKVTLQCIVAGEVPDGVREEFQGRCRQLANTPTSDLWSIGSLYEEFVSREEAEDLAGQDIRFTLFHREVIPVAALPGTRGVTRAVVANLSAKSFSAQVAEKKPNIFSRNVRYHLGKTTRVNKGIRATLASPEGRRVFYYYNNGLTLVCDALEVRTEDMRITLTNPQIVNGCQTAMALCEYRDEFETEDIPLAVRVVMLEDSEAGREQLIRIAENTNSQSPVLSADLKSNDRTQAAIQANFSALESPWFYERKRKEWESLSRADKARFGNRRVTMVDIGQRWRAFAGQPAQAVTQKEELFTNSLVYGEVFRRDRDVREYLFAHKLFSEFDTLLAAERQGVREQVAGGDFDRDQLTRVLRAKKLWVAHMAALTGELIERVYGTRNAGVLAFLMRLLDAGDPGFDQVRIWVIAVFKQWARALPADADLRQKFKDASVASSLVTVLDDQIRMNRGVAQFRTLFPALA